MCIYVLCMVTCVCACMYMCMWRLQVDVRNLPQFPSTNQAQVSSLDLSANVGLTSQLTKGILILTSKAHYR